MQTRFQQQQIPILTVLVRHDQVLTAVVELKVTRRFSTRVEIADGHKLATILAVLDDLKDDNRLVTTVTDNDEMARFVDANTTTRVHGGRKGRRNRLDGLNESQGGASLVVLDVRGRR